jgi:hypothetical protein
MIQQAYLITYDLNMADKAGRPLTTVREEIESHGVHIVASHTHKFSGPYCCFEVTGSPSPNFPPHIFRMPAGWKPKKKH